MDKEEQTITGIDVNRVVVGLDIGSSKIGVFIGEIQDDARIKIVGFGSTELKKGAINELESTVQALKNAVQQAETTSGVDVKHVYVGVAGSNIRSIASQGVVPLKDFAGSVTEVAMRRAVEQASAVVPHPMDTEIIHVLPGDFSVDEQKELKNPLGMEGVRLSVDVQLVMAQQGIIQNIRKAVERADLVIDALVLEPLAAACSVLYEDEKELGVALIDIGAGSTDVAVFKGDKVVYTVSFDIAGNAITSDIAYGLKTPMNRAEEIKKKYGTCSRINLLEGQKIPVPGIGGREEQEYSRKHLAYIIYCRMEEIFKKVNDDLHNKGFDKQLGAGIVITGGTSSMDGSIELAEEVFRPMPVRRGVPQKSQGLGEIVTYPVYSTGVGLLYYAAKNRKKKVEPHETKATKIVATVEGFWTRIWKNLKNYI
ncbi:MAG: cell division protein FtsA [Fibrobacteraceae bacterium]|nr:cell division protein FtsA [Fibrobacteraceae bacterium]